MRTQKTDTNQIEEILKENPELGITPQEVNGKQLFRHRATPGAPGVWIATKTVKDITSIIPPKSTTVESGVAGAVVTAIETYDLGKDNLKRAYERHYQAVLSGQTNNIPEADLKEAQRLAKKYGLKQN